MHPAGTVVSVETAEVSAESSADDAWPRPDAKQLEAHAEAKAAAAFQHGYKFEAPSAPRPPLHVHMPVSQDANGQVRVHNLLRTHPVIIPPQNQAPSMAATHPEISRARSSQRNEILERAELLRVRAETLRGQQQVRQPLPPLQQSQQQQVPQPHQVQPEQISQQILQQMFQQQQHVLEDRDLERTGSALQHWSGGTKEDMEAMYRGAVEAMKPPSPPTSRQPPPPAAHGNGQVCFVVNM